MLNKFLNKLDQFFLEINDYWEDKKGKLNFGLSIKFKQ